MRLKKFATLASVVLVATATPAVSAPFGVQYQSSVDFSGIHNISAGDRLTVTLIVDNGGTTSTSQTWYASDIKCLVFSFGDNHQTYYAQDFYSQQPNTFSGLMTTDSSGNLTDLFTEISATNQTSFTSSQSDTVINWYINSRNGILSNQDGGVVSDVNGGILTAPSAWSTPASSISGCSQSTASQYSSTPSAVPTLTEWALILFATLLGGSAAILATRRRKAN